MPRIVDILLKNKEPPADEALDDRSSDKNILHRVLCRTRRQDHGHRIVQSLHLHAILAYAVSSPLIDDLFNLLNNVYKSFTRI
jgi:hypothetical protein